MRLYIAEVDEESRIDKSLQGEGRLSRASDNLLHGQNRRDKRDRKTIVTSFLAASWAIEYLLRRYIRSDRMFNLSVQLMLYNFCGLRK